MNEKLLNNLISSAIRSGDITLELSDEIVDRMLDQPCAELSEVTRARVKSKLKTRIENDAIASAKRAVKPEPKIPLGRFIQTIRERAGLSRTVIAERLRKTDDYVERLERGHISPLQLSTLEFADLIELFQLKCALLAAMISASVDIAGARKGYRALARSHGGLKYRQRGEDVEVALEAFARTARPKSTGSSSLPHEIQACLSRIEAELRRRGRTDLIT